MVLYLHHERQLTVNVSQMFVMCTQLRLLDPTFFFFFNFGGLPPQPHRAVKLFPLLMMSKLPVKTVRVSAPPSSIVAVTKFKSS